MLGKLFVQIRQQWMGALALFLVLSGGTAYAANTVGSSDIIDESILSQDVKNSEVKSVDIANQQVTSADVKDDSLPNGGLGSIDLAAASVGSDEIATDAVKATEIANDSIDTGEIVDNSLFASDLGTNSVGASELQDGVVNSAEVANNSLTTADIAGADVNGGQISIGGGQVGNARCRQFDSPIGGAKAGEAVVYSTQGPLQDGIMIYGQRVVSDGHVTVDVCNFSGTIQAAITNLPVRVITFG
jgi:hypothetical protein